jgi:hypothetical protein
MVSPVLAVLLAVLAGAQVVLETQGVQAHQCRIHFIGGGINIEDHMCATVSWLTQQLATIMRHRCQGGISVRMGVRNRKSPDTHNYGICLSMIV